MPQQYSSPYPDPYRRTFSAQQPYAYPNTQPTSIPIRPAPTPGYNYNNQYYYPTSPSTPSSSYSTSPQSPTNNPYSQSPPAPTTGPGSYFCLWQNCTYSCTRNADLQRHYQNVHNRESAQLVDCLVQGCHRRGAYGFTRKDKMVEHVREVHRVEIPKRERGGGREGAY